MKVSRTLLYSGVFLVAAGGVVLLAAGGSLDPDKVAEALRLWPLAVVAIGVALLLRRTRLATAGGVTAAVLPGLMLGGLVVAAPSLGPACTDIAPAGVVAREGTFGGAATVDLRLACGSLTVGTAPGTGWRVEAGTGSGSNPSVDATSGRLVVASATERRPFAFARGGDSWHVVLPTESPLDLSAEVSAGRGSLDLTGANLASLRLVANAGDLRVDMAHASVGQLSLVVNAGAAAVSLGSDQNVRADIAVTAGAVRICAPADLGLRIRQDGVLSTQRFAGLARSGDTWESPGYATANHHADVTIRANVGSVDVNPVGGCQ